MIGVPRGRRPGSGTTWWSISGAGWALGSSLLALLVVLALPGPADAHTRTQETTNVESRITSTPPLGAVVWTVHTGGFLIEVVNRGEQDLIVHGYEGEPFLRIGPDGVQQNRRSPATYLNRARYDRVTVPPNVDPSADPDWETIRDEPRIVWHDHRTHWMSPSPPRFVAANPLLRGMMELELVGPVGAAHDRSGSFARWELPVTYEGRSAELVGELVWVDPPSPVPWLLVGAVLVLPVHLVGRRREPAERIRMAAWLVLGVSVVNGLHLIDDLVAFPADPLDELSGLLHTSIFLLAGAGGAAWSLWVRSGPRLTLGVGSGAVLYHQGLVHLPMLFASNFPTVWSDHLVRLTIALSLLQAVVVAIVLVRTRDPADDRPGGCDDRGCDDRGRAAGWVTSAGPVGPAAPGSRLGSGRIPSMWLRREAFGAHRDRPRSAVEQEP